MELRPSLLKVFPPALLGRIVTIPYYPLSPEMLGGIVKLQLNRVGKRVEDNHGAKFIYGDQRSSSTSCRCATIPDSGGRVIDNIITGSILPSLSREILKRSLQREEIAEAKVSVADGQFAYEVS